MDIVKLFKKVIQSEDLQDIPVIYICIIFNTVMEAISSGECFYTAE